MITRNRSLLPLVLALAACGSGQQDVPDADPDIEGCPLLAQTSCDGSCVDTSSDDNHCGGCGQPCGASMVCAGSQCVAGAPILTSDTFGSASALPRGTQSFVAGVTFSQPVFGVDASTITVDHGGYATGFTTTDQTSYTFTVAGLRNATMFAVSFGAGIHNSAGIALIPAVRSLGVAGTVYYVVPGGRGTKSGLTPANAMAEPAYAADAAAAAGGADVWVAAGTYSTVHVQPGTSLYGGFDDTFATRDPNVHETVLASDRSVVNAYGGPASGMSFVDGFTLRATHTTDLNNFAVDIRGPGHIVLSHDVIESIGIAAQNITVFDPYGLAVVDRCTVRASGVPGRGYAGSGVVSNSVIRARAGVYFTGNAVLANCTLLVTTCIEMSQATPVVANNVFVGNGAGTCIESLGASGGDVSRLENNDFFGFESLYFSARAGSLTSISSLNSASTIGAVAATSNRNVAPALDANDEPTSATPLTVTQGGRDTSTSMYGGVVRDRDERARTTPYSIGAFERD